MNSFKLSIFAFSQIRYAPVVLVLLGLEWLGISLYYIINTIVAGEGAMFDKNSWGLFFVLGSLITLPLFFFSLLWAYLKTHTEIQNRLRNSLYYLTRTPGGVRIGLLIFLICFLGFSLITGQRHDYRAYVDQWANVLAGGDPWELVDVNPNAYGPLYNTLALLQIIHPLAPKTLFCLAFVGGALYLVKRFSQYYSPDSWTALVLLVYLFGNPFFWLRIGEYGSFDILPALLSLGAVVLIYRGLLGWSGFALGLGVLFKYYPVVLLPFLVFQRKKICWKTGRSCFLTVTGGLGLSTLIWGFSTFNPFIYSSDRQSKTLSIFRFLRGRFSPLQLLIDQPNLDAYSMLTMGVAILLVCFLCWRWRVEVSLAVIAGMLSALTFYKVGHYQFYMTIFFLVPLWYLVSNLSSEKKNKILWPLGFFVVWLIFGAIAYNVSGRFSGVWGNVREAAGLPTFCLAIWTISTSLYLGRNSARPRYSTNALETAEKHSKLNALESNSVCD